MLIITIQTLAIIFGLFISKVKLELNSNTEDESSLSLELKYIESNTPNITLYYGIKINDETKLDELLEQLDKIIFYAYKQPGFSESMDISVNQILELNKTSNYHLKQISKQVATNTPTSSAFIAQITLYLKLKNENTTNNKISTFVPILRLNGPYKIKIASFKVFGKTLKLNLNFSIQYTVSDYSLLKLINIFGQEKSNYSIKFESQIDKFEINSKNETLITIELPSYYDQYDIYVSYKYDKELIPRLQDHTSLYSCYEIPYKPINFVYEVFENNTLLLKWKTEVTHFCTFKVLLESSDKTILTYKTSKSELMIENLNLTIDYEVKIFSIYESSCFKEFLGNIQCEIIESDALNAYLNFSKGLCFKEPSEPFNLNYVFQSNESLTLFWKEPNTINSPRICLYNVTIENENEIRKYGQLIYPSIGVYSIDTHRNYNITIEAINSAKCYSEQYKDCDTKTSKLIVLNYIFKKDDCFDAPSTPRDFKYTLLSNSEVLVSWKEPIKYNAPSICYYKLNIEGANVDSTTLVTETSFKLTNLDLKKTYNISVRAINNKQCYNNEIYSNCADKISVEERLIFKQDNTTNIAINSLITKNTIYFITFFFIFNLIFTF